MRRWFPFLTAIVLSILLKNKKITASSVYDEQQLLMEAGCKFLLCGHMCETPKWAGSGQLLEKGACIERTYRKSVVPEKGITKVLTTFTDHKVRGVHDRKKQVSIDFTIRLRWIDPGIKTNFSKEDIKNGGIVLEVEQLNKIWKPDLYIYNLSDYNSYSESKQIKSFILLPTNESNLNDSMESTIQEQSQTIVEFTVEAKAIIYCNFDLAMYPMDSQMCNFRFGSRSSGTTFMLDNPNNIYHQITNYNAENFNITTTFFDEQLNTGKNTIGFDIQMDRILKPFIMEYYLPCMAIVLVSHIGFVIPLTAIPGRIALLVTQFLTITNLFIHQMVCYNILIM